MIDGTLSCPAFGVPFENILAYLDVVLRIARLAADPQLAMQMRGRGPSRASDRSDAGSTLDSLSDRHRNVGEMSIPSDETLTRFRPACHSVRYDRRKSRRRRRLPARARSRTTRCSSQKPRRDDLRRLVAVCGVTSERVSVVQRTRSLLAKEGTGNTSTLE
jgi:hypothetical protein